MYHNATTRVLIATVAAAAGLWAQPADWHRIGNAAIDRSLAGLAGGPVDRVWFSPNGSLMAHTPDGRAFETTDFESWRAVSAQIPPEPPRIAVNLPESAARVRGQSQAIYAVGKFAYRSENNGATWENLTGFRGASLVGDGLTDLAVSPANDQEIAISGANGVFRSMDGGKSWSSLNQGLPNLPVTRLLSLPSGERGARIALADGAELEWQPGQKIAWRETDRADVAAEAQERQNYSFARGARVTAIAKSGDYLYLGMSDGVLDVSRDNGQTWTRSVFNEAGPAERIWIDPADARVALAVFGAKPHDPLSPVAPVRVARTLNGGIFWDNFTANLPGGGAHGVTADDASGAIYVAADAGVLMAYTDFHVLGNPPQWILLNSPAQGPAVDVKLDEQGNQLWAAFRGFGVYATLAPHRLRDPRVVNTADLIAGATAPGALVSVLGRRVQTARAGNLQIPVLDANDAESQLQIPFEAGGSSVSLAIAGPGGDATLAPIPLQPAAPAIFTDRDGSPVLLDGESGLMLDAMNPAHSHGRIQILATGLGRVNPDWPTGLPGPAENPPAVSAPVHAYLDRQPVEVTRAVLAPYIGFYLVELEVPKIVNYGPAELYIDVNGQASNRVRVYIEP